MALAPAAVEALIAAVTGPVLFQGDPGIPTEIGAFNTFPAHDPEVLVAAESEGDVVAAVRFALENDLAVRTVSTGHGSPTPIVDGVLVSLRRFHGVSIDPDARIAVLRGGTRWGEVIEAAALHGLAPITGSSATVGAIGYTLGGGLGPLARTFGFSSDWARGFRVVSGEGQVVVANEFENADLFWALRGGKGGFGVVTEMTVELVPLTTLYAGSVLFDAPHIQAVYKRWADWSSDLPETVTTAVALASFPPIEAIPEPMRGKTLLAVRYAFIGDAAEGERLFEPIRSAAPVYLDGVRVMGPADVAEIHSDPADPGPSWDRGMMLDRVDGAFVDTLLGAIGPGTHTPIMACEVRRVGGATERDVPGGSAVGGRGAGYALVLIGAPDPALFDAVLPSVADGLTGALAPWVSAVTTPNWAGGFGVPGTFEASWPAHIRERLAAIRADYDPAGLFPFAPSP